MKMNYRQQHKKGGKERFVIATIFLILFIIYITHFVFPALLPNVAHSFSRYVWIGSQYVEDVASFSTFRNKKDLIEENKELKDRLNEAYARLVSQDVILEEVRELRDVLELRPFPGFLSATVLSRPPRTPYDILIIDIGRSKDIFKNDLVLAGEFIALGKIEEVFNRTSSVSLFSTPGIKTEVFFEGIDGTFIAEGRGGGALRALIPQDIDITSSSDVSTLSSSRNYLIGKVAEVVTSETSPFQSVYIKTPVDIFNLRRVFVTDGDNIYE